VWVDVGVIMSEGGVAGRFIGCGRGWMGGGEASTGGALNMIRSLRTAYCVLKISSFVGAV